VWRRLVLGGLGGLVRILRVRFGRETERYQRASQDYLHQLHFGLLQNIASINRPHKAAFLLRPAPFDHDIDMSDGVAASAPQTAPKQLTFV
jgi:hypothetical protein